MLVARMELYFIAVSYLLLQRVRNSLSKPERFEFLNRDQENFAKTLKDYDITYPTILTKESNYLDDELKQESGQRKRRSLTGEDSRLKYQLRLFNKVLTLHLEKKNDLLSPGFVVETADGIIHPHRSFCEYQGTVNRNSKSLVALSTCFGLRGILKTGSGSEYIIEPIEGYSKKSNRTEKPHLVYNARHLSEGNRKYSVEGIANERTCASRDYTNGRSRVNGKEHSPYSSSANNARRLRRSVSIERYVETLVVADQSVLNFYKGQNIEQYVLTVMNMVSALYHDASIGASINIVLVRLILLEKEVPELKISHNADTTLASFCDWSSKINPDSEEHPQHHDVAVLLTRTDICRGINKPCGTLGLGQVDGMCTSSRSCNINEDTGLSVAYTIAHELGHNFGMEHDGSGNDCKYPQSLDKYVMSPKQSVLNHPYMWSSCSREYLESFFHKGWGECLNDLPSKYEYPYKVLPPGVIYDFNQQCKMRHGSESGVCKIRLVQDSDPCSRLWCKYRYHSTSTCVMRSKPAADGTSCKNGHWCMKGKCVPKKEPKNVVNGGWSEWKPWTKCTRTCGGGVQYKERHCSNPRPRNGGKYCLGRYRKYQLCNTKPCPKTSTDFRDQQCIDAASKSYLNYVSMPQHLTSVYFKSKPCELHCKRVGSYHIIKFGSSVLDGTPCREGTNDLCIRGKCMAVGCDWVLNSKAKEDKCGVCHGSGTSCKTIKSQFNKTILAQGDYVETAFIPSGARNIRVEEVAGAKNYLALKSSQGKFYLNGDWQIQRTGKYEAAGTKVFYSRKNQKDFLRAIGPTQEDLHVLLFVQGPNPGVSIEFTIPKAENDGGELTEYLWRYRKWSKCSSKCGVGFQYTEPECIEKKDKTVVDDTYCQARDKPNRLQRACNTENCPPEWWTGQWQTCNRRCGPGISVRSVMCIRRLREDEQLALRDEECANVTKPKATKICFKRPCKAKWIVGKWEKCSTACGLGVQRRQVTCSANRLKWCQLFPKPIHVKLCNGTKCPRWIVSRWTNCSPKCGMGTKKRLVACIEGQSGRKINNKNCDRKSQPSTIMKCTNGPCLQWEVTKWSQCSKTCGNGTQTRTVLCPGQSFQCDAQKYPKNTRSCSMGPCAVWKTSPWGQCNENCMQWRTVICKEVGSLRDSNACPASSKPSGQRKCSTSGKCGLLNLVQRRRPCYADQLSRNFCEVVRIAGFCSSSRYHARCCRTCGKQ